MSEKILNVSDSSFSKDVLSVKGMPVIVDFWASWCGPCRMLTPRLEAAVDTFAGRALIAKYNVDENQQVAAANNIRSIPTLLVYKNGELVAQHTGAMSSTELDAFITQHL